MQERIDRILVQKKLFPTRQKAVFAIEQGIVFVNEQRVTKPSKKFELEAELKIELRGESLPFVSRGGLKLQKALDIFPINLCGKICMDIGASTGGFTDCMLQHSAKKVYAIDVGHDQLDPSLQNNPNVINKEGINIKDIDIKTIEPVQFISVDVSFISITQVLPIVYDLLLPDGECVILIKPQFEAGKEHLSKTGVVTEPKVHKKILQTRISFALLQHFHLYGLDYSPIKGPAGNIEYLLFLKKENSSPTLVRDQKQWIEQTVETAFHQLK